MPVLRSLIPSYNPQIFWDLFPLPPTPDFLTFPKIQGQTTIAVPGSLVPMLVTLENCCLFQEPQPLSLSLFGISKSPLGAFSREILPDRTGDFSSLPAGPTSGYSIHNLTLLTVSFRKSRLPGVWRLVHLPRLQLGSTWSCGHPCSAPAGTVFTPDLLIGPDGTFWKLQPASLLAWSFCLPLPSLLPGVGSIIVWRCSLPAVRFDFTIHRHCRKLTMHISTILAS